MQWFKLKTRIGKYDSFAAFAKEYNLREDDLVITNEFLYKPFMEPLHLQSRFVMQEKYGLGEPSDEMMNSIIADLKGVSFRRVIAVGGGTVIDISKIFALQGITNVTDAFEKKVPLVKEKQLVIIPTTAGTGSEVTNLSIAEIKSKHTKLGLATDEILADDAVIIPELLRGLPFKFYMFSAIDALIHATESYVSPKSNPYTKIFDRSAIETIIDIFRNIASRGEEYRFERLEDILVAANFAGIGFGNTGVGAVHALSYPLGGTYHVPHGESNARFFTAVFKFYQQKNPGGSNLLEVMEILQKALGVDDHVFDAIDALLLQLIKPARLSDYGMRPEEIETFTKTVVETQQRLLANNYVPMTDNEIRAIYQSLY